MAYTRYGQYNPENVILPYDKFPSYQQIEKIKPYEKEQPYTPFYGWDDERRAVYNARKNKQVKTFLANYNDPTELNSFIDALTNREAVSKKFGDAWGTVSTASGTAAILSFTGAIIAAALSPVTGGASVSVAAALAKTGAIAAIPAIPAATEVTIEKGIKPIIAGKPKEALLNTLMNVGESADFLSNPVKGFFLEGPEGLAKGSGLANGGRVNYDFDTGFFLTDMLLETLVDPLNWVEFGTKTALSKATKALAQESTQQVVDSTLHTVNKAFAKTYGEITAEGAERISKKVTKTTAQVARDWADKSFNNLTDAARERLLRDGRQRIQQSLVAAIQKELPEATASDINLILKKSGKDLATGRFIKSTVSQISDITFDTLSTDVIKGLAGVQHYTDVFQRFMTKGAMMSSGYGLGIEAAKNGWKGIKAWANNITLNRLKRATVFDNLNGLDIKQWEKAKNIWEASYKYTSDLTGDISQRDMNAFYAFANQQFNRDKQLIIDIIRDGKSPATKAARLDAQIKAVYNCDFKEYIGYLKGINDAENGVYSKYIQYLESVKNTIDTQAFTKPMGAHITTGKALFSPKELEAQNVIKNLQDAIKTSKNKVELSDKLYTIKLNNAYVNSELMNNVQIALVLTDICSSEQTGALLDKIKGDVNSLAPEVAAQIPVYIRTLKDAGNSFMNTHNFYNEIAELPLEKIKGISDADFKRYIIDQISNTNKTVSELLAGFDSTTMPDLVNGLQTMLYDKGFKFADYPVMKDQIAGVYRRFLEAQEAVGIENISATIVEDFTQSLNDLIKYMPQYAKELEPFTIASKEITRILSSVKNVNADLLERVFTDKATIFNLLNTRQLSDAGLALKTVALKENLDMFNLTDTLSGNIVSSANDLGKALRHTKDSLAQYNVYFDTKKAANITEAYKDFRLKFIDNPDFTEAGAFKYLKPTEDPLEQFAQLVEFNKLAKDNITAKDFKSMLHKHLGTTEYLNVLDPSGLMVTDFAWNAMAQSAWIAEKQLNENIINSITAYKNLSLNSKKITNDFQAIRDLLSTNKIDRPKLLQQERYIKAASKVNDMLEYLENYYNSLFDSELATKEIESVRNILNNFPDLNDKYSKLVDRIEAYWNGELILQQSPKHMKGQADFVDEVTPFWDEIKEMNKDISKTIKDFNAALEHGINLYGTEMPAKQWSYKPITLWDPVRKQQELNKLINNATDADARSALHRLFNITPEEFKNELAYRRRFITFSEDDVAEHQLNGAFNKFNKSLPEGVQLVHDVENHRYWYVLDKSQKVNMAGRQVYLNDNPIMRLQGKRNFDYFQLVDKHINDAKNPGITKTLNELSTILETLTGSSLGDSQGEYLTQDALEMLYSQMPKEVQDLLPDLTEWTDKQFFEAYIFNESILGSAKSKAALGMYSGNMITNARNAIVQAQGYLKPRNEYVNAVFDSQLSISSPNSIWEKFTDQELLEALQANPEYKLVTLVDDNKYGLKTREILPTSVKAIQKAKELGGWIIPLQTYKDMYNVVNHRIGSTGMAKLWSRIMYSYKFGYLCRPGAWLRNFIDTNIKSKLEMGEEFGAYKAQAHKILDDVDAMKASIKKLEEARLEQAWKDYGDLAQQLFNEKERIEQFVQRRSKDGYIRDAAIKDWFANNPTKILDYDMYKELNSNFLSQGISGNIMADLYKTEGGDLWNTFTELTGNILEAGNRTENYNRLAVYLYELDHGLDYTSALSKLAKTHFDYSFKTKAEQLADMVFPFTTFSMRNYSYWIEMIEKYPWIMRNYAHLMKPHWDFKDYTPEELARDRRVQTQILYGQLKLAEFNNKVLLFKANPSIQDAIQMFSDPINNVYEKLAAPIAFPINTMRGEYTNPLNIIPIAGQATQSIQTAAKTGTPLPSAIGVQSKPKRTGKVNFSNPNLSGTDKYTDNTYRTPKYRNNIVYDSYMSKGVKRYKVNMYPIVDVLHDIKMRYSVNVYNRVKNRVKVDVYNGIRYRLKLDANTFR